VSLWFWAWYPPEQMVTIELRPPPVLDPDVVEMQRDLDRKAAAEARRAQGQLSEAARAAIDKLERHPGGASSHWIAEQMQNNPATAVVRLKREKPMLKDGKPVLMTVEHLARKITGYRKQK
jgi:hypothetical protein